MEDPLDDEYEEDLHPTTTEPSKLDTIKNDYFITYSQDQLDSFNDFIKLSKLQTKNIVEVKDGDPIETFQKSEAEMYHGVALGWQLAIHKVRSIDDVVKVNKGIIDFTRARRELLCKDKEEVPNSWKPVKPL